jgi:hypothetical protein
MSEWDGSMSQAQRATIDSTCRRPKRIGAEGIRATSFGVMLHIVSLIVTLIHRKALFVHGKLIQM